MTRRALPSRSADFVDGPALWGCSRAARTLADGVLLNAAEDRCPSGAGLNRAGDGAEWASLRSTERTDHARTFRVLLSAAAITAAGVAHAAGASR
jgi:hypothetical protein